MGPADVYVTALAINPQQPGTLFVGTFDHGAYKSTDAGRSWRGMNFGLTNKYIGALAIDPRTPTTIYAAAGDSRAGGVFKSTDGGESWRAINNGLPRSSFSIHALAIDPQTPTTLYAGTAFRGVFKSTDGGGSWAAVNNGLPSTRVSIEVYALAIDPQTPTTLYAGTRGGVFKSTDAGGSWLAMNTGLDATGLDPRLKPADQYYRDRIVLSLAIDPRTPTTLYAITLFGEGTEVQGLFKSTDGASSWRAINKGLADVKVNVLAIDPQPPTIIYAGTWHGVFGSTDGGETWRANNDGLTDLSVRVLTIGPGTPTTLYAGTWGSGVFVNGTVSGIGAPPNSQSAGSPADSGSVAYLSAGEKGSVWLVLEIRGDLPIYAGSHKIVLYTMASPQSQWTKVLDASGRGAIKRLWFFGLGRVSAWVEGERGQTIMSTADGGAHWRSSPPLVYGPIIGASFISPADGWMLIHAGAGMSAQWSAVDRTVDGGNHWTEIALVRPDHYASGLSSEGKTGIEFRDANNGWIGTDPSVTSEMPYLYMSQDGGATWKRQSLPPPTGTSDDWTGRIFPPKFFGGRTGVAVARLYRRHEVVHHVYATADGGRTWGDPRPFPIAEGNRDTIVWDSFSPTVWAAAASQTLWLTLDAGRTWSRRAVPLPPSYKIDKVAFTGPAHVWVIGSAVPPGSRSTVADYVLETSDGGLHWTRVALPQVH